MTKADLIAVLERYTAYDNLEETHRLQTLFFLKHADNCYDRSNLEGHITGSAFVINTAGDKTLFMHHAVLKQWYKPGGHCDGSEDVLAAAHREGQEETGIMELDLVLPTLLDIDVHAIPTNPNKNEPAHLHYDVTYLFQAKHMNFVDSSESLALAWLTPDEALAKQNKPHYQRMIAKWLEFVQKDQAKAA